jgi:type IV/VI secretion system ImpK/VasF family protein
VSRDSEYDSRDAGDAPAPDTANAPAGDEPAFQSKPFRSWSTARGEDSTPSFWSRVGGLFRKQEPGSIADSDQHVDDSIDAKPVAPPDDFAFPWTRADETPAEAPVSSLPEPDSDLKFFEAPTKIIPELAPLSKRPGFFARLFGRKVKAMPLAEAVGADEPLVPTNEYPGEEHVTFHSTAFEAPTSTVAEAFASVDDALPAADDAATELPFVPLDDVAPPQPKPGLFERLLRRSSKSTKRPSLEVEIHEDRIAAAADALDDAGEKSFAENQESPVGSADPFASVEEALPGDAESRDTIEVQADLSARPDLSETLDTPVIPPVEFERIAPPTPDKPDLDRTLEVEDPLDNTLEIVRDDAATFEPIPDTTELEGDTDEFEVVTAPPPDTTLQIPPDENTAEVSRKSLVDSLLFWRGKRRAAGTPAAAATLVEGGPAFLFTKFRTFYNEIIRFKHEKTKFTAGFATAMVSDYSADLGPDGAADALSKKLAAMLELQAAEAKWMGGESAERYPDAQYAMAALADETFLNLEWEGQGAWQKYLLEPKLFRTRAADVELFRRIDKLLKDQPDSSAARDLARVYLLVLAAGFRGKYRPFGLTRALAEYRQRLYEYIHFGGDALLIYDPQRRIFPEAAQRTLEGEAVTRFTAAQRWAAILIFLVVGYTTIAHIAWSRVSADLRDVTDRIKAGSTAGGGATP